MTQQTDQRQGSPATGHERQSASPANEASSATPKGDAEFAGPGAGSSDVTRQQGPAGWLAGNLTSDPKIIYTRQGVLMVKLRVACSERVRDPATGGWKEGPTRYLDVTCFGKLAENVGEHFRRGDRIVGGGTWQREKWTDIQGEAHEKISLLARDLGPSVTFRAARYIDTMTQETE